MWLLTVMTIAACSDDDQMPQQKFSFEGKNVSLANAKLYLASEAIVNDHLTRNYYISDGTYTGGDGRDLTSYTGATYALAIRIGVPKAGQIEPGSFPQYSTPLNPAENSKFSQITFVSTNYRFQTSANTVNGSAVVISGGVHPDETMTLQFSGSLTRYFVITEEPEGPFSGKFHVKAKVVDKRPE